MHFHEFIHMTHNVNHLWNFLCEKKMLQNEIICPRCEHLIKLNNAAENHIFHCRNAYYKIHHRKRQRVVCNFKMSAFHGIWFDRAHLSVSKICQFIAYFLIMPPPRHRFLINELELTEHTVIDWTNFCREVGFYLHYLVI